MAPAGSDLPRYAGELRVPGSASRPATVSLDEGAVVLSPENAPPRTIAYRDLAVIGISGSVGLLATGDAPDAERWLLERFGPAIGPLVAEIRERRLRQRLDDAFVVLPDGAPVDLAEYAVAAPAAGASSTVPGPGSPVAVESGIAQLAIDGWGLTLAPLDERLPVRRVRRADITAVDLLPAVGGVRVTAGAGGFDLLRMGPASIRVKELIAELPSTAYRDAGAILGTLAPDLPTGSVALATGALLDGRPASPADLGAAWEPLERSVLGTPTFAASYAALRARAGGANALRWMALAPVQPGSPDDPKLWFLVALPGNLVALELVSEGAHATYCFRTVPRATYGGDADVATIDPSAARIAVAGVSAALVDARFLREPIALPDDQLGTPKGLRYRLALRAIPSLAMARRYFVARLVHRDEASWGAALDDLIAWHATCRDDAAVWPGRAGQESQVSDAAGSDGPP